VITGVLVAFAAMIGDAAETYDLTNVGTLFAFALVCAGVMVLRVKEPERPRPFKVPFVWVTAPLGILACVFVMAGCRPRRGSGLPSGSSSAWPSTSSTVTGTAGCGGVELGACSWLRLGLRAYAGYGCARVDCTNGVEGRGRRDSCVRGGRASAGRPRPTPG